MLFYKMSLTLWLHEVSLKCIDIVGGKAASLGEMISNLPDIRIPPGFVITTLGFQTYLQFNHIQLSDSDIRERILNGTMPKELQMEIQDKYRQMDNCDVAVRSSST